VPNLNGLLFDVILYWRAFSSVQLCSRARWKHTYNWWGYYRVRRSWISNPFLNSFRSGLGLCTVRPH